MSLNFLIRQPWVSANVNESKLSEIREDQMKEEMNRAHALITSSPPENGTQYVVAATLHCSMGTDQPAHSHRETPFGHLFCRRPQHHP